MICPVTCSAHHVEQWKYDPIPRHSVRHDGRYMYPRLSLPRPEGSANQVGAVDIHDHICIFVPVVCCFISRLVSDRMGLLFLSTCSCLVLSATQRISLGTMYTVPRVHVGRYFAGIGRFLRLGFNLPMPGSRVLRSSRVANYSKWRRESDRMERTGIHNPPK